MSESHGPFRLDQPGIYNLTDEIYHSDPVVEPSLSASMAKTLVRQSPMHAKLSHPRLTVQPEQKESALMDMGSALHALLFQPDLIHDLLDIIHEKDWRKKPAQEARALARAAGHAPVLVGQFEEAEKIVTALANAKNPPFPAGGFCEKTFIWQWGKIWCRAKIDYITEDGGKIRDYKTTGQLPGDPEDLRGRAFDMGWDVQSAFYRRTVRELTGKDTEMEFIVQETKPPHDYHVIVLGADVDMIGEKKILMARDMWENGVLRGKWPGYSHRKHVITLPPWIEARWLDKEEEE